MFNSNSGYVGQSMSIRAEEAYENGEKPFSKWTKEEMIYECKKEKISPDILVLLSKTSTRVLRNNLLYKSSWHHTGSYFNETSFFMVDACEITLEKAKEMAETKTEKKEPEEIKYYNCNFLEWSGSKKHPHAETINEDGYIKGNWFYRKDGSKKYIYANGFEKVKEIKKTAK